MYLGYAIVGLIIGVLIAGLDNAYTPMIGAVAIAVLLARLVQLERRVQRLESSARRDNVPVWGKTPVSDIPEAVSAGKPPTGSEHGLQDHVVAENTLDPALRQESMFDSRSPAPKKAPERIPPVPSLLQLGIKKATDWITTGNVPVKVGVIISFIGVGFLLKYAIDRQLLIVPIQIRLLTVAAAGMALLVIGWRLRKKDRVYALSLQGGGAGILYLTIFAALRIWQLLPASLAFLLLIALTVVTGFLAVRQNSRTLVILGVVGGFLAPVLTSTGQGSHVVLFSYYLVLNGAILGIAWFRAWRGLNLIGWVFTFLIGSAWGYQYYKPELLTSTQPFLVLYFLFYQAIAILFALRQPPKRIGLVDGTLVFGTPVIVFALQAALVEGVADALAISAAVVAAFYALTAAWLWRSKGESLRLLTESFLAMAVAFATITIPLALDARWTAAAWALEGAALVWVGTRQGRQLAKLAGVLLIFLSGVSFVDHGWRNDAGLPILNGNVLGGLLISLSALFTSRRLEVNETPVFATVQKLASVLLLIWGVLWWLGTGWMETTDRAVPSSHFHLFLLFLSLSTAVGTWLGRTRDWSGLRRATLAFLPLLAPLAFLCLWEHSHFLTGIGWLVWPLALLSQVFVLYVMDENKEWLAAAWHFGSLLFFTVLFAFEAMWFVDRLASSAWVGATAATVPGIMSLLVWRFSRRPAWPVPAHAEIYLAGRAVLVTSQVLLLAWLAITMPGDPSPWPYIPVLNPFDLGMLFALLTSMVCVAGLKRETTRSESWKIPLYLYRLILSATFFIMTTLALVRAVHHYSGVPWNTDDLYASIMVQTGLSIYWGLLGFVGMIWGARSSRRAVWLAGVGFMVLVVIKLFLIDLGNTGTVERIISFIGIGVLLLFVGYFAPAPPRAGRNSG